MNKVTVKHSVMSGFFLALLIISASTASEVLDALPEKGIEGSELEFDITTAAREWASFWKWKHDVIYAYPTDLEWEIVRHPLNNQVTGREVMGVIVTQGALDDCKVHYAKFVQSYREGSFDGVKMKSLLQGHDTIECSKL